MDVGNVVGDWNIDVSPKLSASNCSLVLPTEDCHREDSRNGSLSKHVDIFASQIDFLAMVEPYPSHLCSMMLVKA